MSEKVNKVEFRKTISPIIGSYFRDLRVSRNLTQKELSEELGITATYIGYVENAKRLPSTDVVSLYAEYFKHSLDELLMLRKLTIFETVELLGSETPPAIKNERNMILHASPDFIIRDSKNNEYAVEVKAKAEVKPEDKLSAHIVIAPDGTIKVNGETISPEDLSAKLDEIKELANKNKN